MLHQLDHQLPFPTRIPPQSATKVKAYIAPSGHRTILPSSQIAEAPTTTTKTTSSKHIFILHFQSSIIRNPHITSRQQAHQLPSSPAAAFLQHFATKDLAFITSSGHSLVLVCLQHIQPIMLQHICSKVSPSHPKFLPHPATKVSARLAKITSIRSPPPFNITTSSLDLATPHGN